MDGIGSVGSGDFNYRATNGTNDSKEQSPNLPWKRVGMEDAMTLSSRHLAKALTEAGFVDLHANAPERIQAFVRRQTSQEESPQARMDPVIAAQLATYVGGQIAHDMSWALQVAGQIDPARAAALLK
ncbi:MAG TPA: hypothetical protein VLI39_20465 [Sedimentisphaerales bacterium]|nr:hypothetical protein [Sedimentisphaerales bacterium]